MCFQVDDLSRMYRLYHKIAKGLEPVANIFKQVAYLSLLLWFRLAKSFLPCVLLLC